MTYQVNKTMTWKTNNGVPGSAAFYLCLCNPLMIRCAKTGRCAANYHFLQGPRVCRRFSAKRREENTSGWLKGWHKSGWSRSSFGRFRRFCECKRDRGWALRAQFPWALQESGFMTARCEFPSNVEPNKNKRSSAHILINGFAWANNIVRHFSTYIRT